MNNIKIWILDLGIGSFCQLAPVFIVVIILSLRIQTPPDRIGFFGFQSHPTGIGMDQGNSETLGHTNGFLGDDIFH